MIIERVTTASPELLQALQGLVPQLTTNSPPPQAADLEALVASSSTALVTARLPDENGAIIGTGVLGTYRVPTGLRAVIEDVVVESSARGRGVGEAITRYLLEIAREMGAPGVALTSNPRRLAANRLYVRMGFSLRQTNCYYYAFAQEGG